jgi:hypothetical protein
VESREDADIELELCIREEAGRRDLVWNIGHNEGIARDDENPQGELFGYRILVLKERQNRKHDWIWLARHHRS